MSQEINMEDDLFSQEHSFNVPSQDGQRLMLPTQCNDISFDDINSVNRSTNDINDNDESCSSSSGSHTIITVDNEKGESAILMPSEVPVGSVFVPGVKDADKLSCDTTPKPTGIVLGATWKLASPDHAKCDNSANRDNTMMDSLAVNCSFLSQDTLEMDMPNIPDLPSEVDDCDYGEDTNIQFSDRVSQESDSVPPISSLSTKAMNTFGFSIIRPQQHVSVYDTSQRLSKENHLCTKVNKFSFLNFYTPLMMLVFVCMVYILGG